MKHEITIENIVSKCQINKVSLRRIVELVLTGEGISESVININLIDDKQIIKLNKQFLQKDSTTDVLSFVLEKDVEVGFWEGEVYANVEQVERQAKDFNVTFENELFRIVIHGLLHLIGYNDSANEEKQLMTEKEDYYLLLSNNDKGG